MFVFRPWRAEDDFLRSVFDWPSSRFTLPAMKGDYALSLGAVPLCDVVEDDDGIMLVFDAPGATPEDIVLTYEAGEVKVQIRRPAPTHQGRVFHAERPRGELSRSVAVGSAYDPDSIEAKLHDGLLEVRMNKKPEARPKQIPIAANAPAQIQEKGGDHD